MIILFDENEQEFTTLGLGVLNDASSCIVTEELNGSFELEMEYPVNGIHYKDIQLKRLILTKVNDILQPQPFRIYKITRPINGIVTVYADHISYDTSKVPIKALNAKDLDELIQQIQNRKIISSPFVFKRGSDKSNVQTSFKTKVPYSFRSLLGGEEGSILDTYSGEYIFDRFDITLMNRRGADREFTVRYSKNMTDLEQEISSDLLCDGLLPYYNNTITETKTAIGKKYKEAYISKDAPSTEEIYDQDGVRIYPHEYISYEDAGAGISAILTYVVTNIIASEGEMLNHLVHARKTIARGTEEEDGYIYDVTYKMAYINKDSQNEFGSDWLYEDPELTRKINPVEWDPNSNPYLSTAPIYRIFTEGDKLYNVYIWKYDSKTSSYKYQEPDDDDNIEVYGPQLPNVGTMSEEKDNTIIYEGNIIYVGEVRAIPDTEKEPLSENWLIKIEDELVQSSSEDDRWVLGGTINPQKEINYKVATLEVPIRGYYEAGNLSYDKYWLYSDPELTAQIIPEDGKAYVIESKEQKTLGKDFYYRWSDYDNCYNPRIDTRYNYTNYIWDESNNIYVERDDSNDKIITYNLTDNISDTPKNIQKYQKQFYDQTIKYIKENKLGEVKETIKVSFIKLSSSSEYSKWKELEKVELGDTVHVIYEDIGVNVTKKVIRTAYNVLTDSYDEIELGEKSSKFTNNAIVEGDNVSSLTNDRNFADDTTVTNLFAKYISADYIKSITAEITEAQITSLTSESITANLIEAERFEIDELVAGLLIADNAAIKDTLTAGNIEVSGEINVKSGSIAITKDEIKFLTVAYVVPGAEEYSFYWLKSHQSDVESLIPDTESVYKVYDTNELFKGYYVWSTESGGEYISYNPEIKRHFYVDEDGNLEANSANIKGTITALSGQIGTNCIINQDGELEVPFANITGTVVANSLVVGAEIKNVIITNDETGNSSITGATIDDTSITDTSIQNGEVDQSTGKAPFEVDSEGNVYIREGSIKLGAIDPNNNLAAFDVDNDGDVFIRNGNITMNQGSIKLGQIIDPDTGRPTDKYYFNVDNEGNLSITKGTINLGNGAFSVSEDGGLVAKSIEITEGTLVELNHIESYTAVVSNLQITRNETTNNIETSILHVPKFPDGLSFGDVIIAQDIDSSSYTISTRSFDLIITTSNFNEINKTTTITLKFYDPDHTDNDFGTIDIGLGGGCIFRNRYESPGGTVIQSNYRYELTRRNVSYDSSQGFYTIENIIHGYITASEIVANSIFLNILPRTFDVKVKSLNPDIFLDISHGLLVPNIGIPDEHTNYAYIDDIYAEDINAGTINVNSVTINSIKQPYIIYATKITIPRNSSKRITYSSIRQELGGTELTMDDFISASVVKDYDSNGSHYRYENPEVKVGSFGIDIFSMDDSGDTDYFVTLIFSNTSM